MDKNNEQNLDLGDLKKELVQKKQDLEDLVNALKRFNETCDKAIQSGINAQEVRNILIICNENLSNIAKNAQAENSFFLDELTKCSERLSNILEDTGYVENDMDKKNEVYDIGVSGGYTDNLLEGG